MLAGSHPCLKLSPMCHPSFDRNRRAGADPAEHVLPFVVERKTSQDLLQVGFDSTSRLFAHRVQISQHCPSGLGSHHRFATATPAQSIKDGRYLQQKWRMLSCGLPHRFYLVETSGDRTLSDRDKRVSGAHIVTICNCCTRHVWLLTQLPQRLVSCCLHKLARMVAAAKPALPGNLG